MTAFPRVSINTDTSQGVCFACGRNNPIGLKLSFKPDGNTARAEFTAGRQYQGWVGILHGGIIACILDEAMSYAARFQGYSCITAKMDITFKRPVPVEEPLVITGSIVNSSRKLLRARAQLTLPDGTVAAESTATQLIIEEKSVAGNRKKEPRNNA